MRPQTTGRSVKGVLEKVSVVTVALARAMGESCVWVAAMMVALAENDDRDGRDWCRKPSA